MAVASGKGNKRWSNEKYWEDNSPTTTLLKQKAIQRAEPETLEFMKKYNLINGYPGPLVECDGALLNEDEEQTRRLTHIGGSEVGDILGDGRFASALDIYYRKCGVKGEVMDDPTKKLILAYGHANEDIAAMAMSLKYPEWDIRADTLVYNHPVWPFLSANTDRIIRGTDGCWILGEIKCPVVVQGKQLWGDDENPYVPPEYMYQVRLYMAILGIWQARICVMFGPTDVIYRRVDRDLDEEKRIIEELVDFWENHVEMHIPPNVVSGGKNGKFAFAAVNEYNPLTSDKNQSINLTKNNFETEARNYLRLSSVKSTKKSEIDAIEDEMASICAKIAMVMCNATEGYIDCKDGTTIAVKYAPRKGRRGVDYDILATEFPDAFARCVTAGTPTRPMAIKINK